MAPHSLTVPSTGLASVFLPGSMGRAPDCSARVKNSLKVP